MQKAFLFILRHSPYEGSYAQEMLDMVLAAAAFDQCIRVLMLDDGVYQIVAGQRPDVLALKHITPVFDALPMYDVNEVWVEQESLCERGLTPQRLALPVRLIARADVADLVRRHDIVVSG